MNLFHRLATLLFLLSVTSLCAQQAQNLQDPCGASPSLNSPAAKHFLKFDQFDKELKAALAAKDVVSLAFLVKFPLAVNEHEGKISINDAAALKVHFEEIFTPAVRENIQHTKLDDVGCNAEGVGYEAGAIWVNATERGYAIEAVNSDAPPPAPQIKIPPIQYTCQTQTHRIVIDTLTDGTLRYRSWNKPRSPAETPDLELRHGKNSFEGTNVCAVPIYTFQQGTTEYILDAALGCFDSTHPPPQDATGDLVVKVAGKTITETWCF